MHAHVENNLHEDEQQEHRYRVLKQQDQKTAEDQGHVHQGDAAIRRRHQLLHGLAFVLPVADEIRHERNPVTDEQRRQRGP